MKKLTVIIVSYNVRHYLEQCIDSVLKAAHTIDHDIYVVDNASTDDTVTVLRNRYKEQLTLIECPHNLGFARANNIAIRRTQSQYVLLLNPDTFVAEDSLTTMIQFMDSHPKAGGTGAMMHNHDGSMARESRRGLPTPWVSLLKMLGFSRRYYMSHLSWDQPGQIEVMSGACCMLRRDALDRVGLLDKDFFMYGEDIDLSYRIIKGGYENWYVPASILHYKGESTQKSSYRYVHTFYQAMLIFFRKHYGHLSFIVTSPIKLAIWLRALIALVQMLSHRLRQSLGLGRQPGTDDTRFLFLCSDGTLHECRQLAERKGLDAQFSTDENNSKGQQWADADVVVYDTSRFSYADIIAHAAAPTNGKRPLVGIYHPHHNTIITPTDILQ